MLQVLWTGPAATQNHDVGAMIAKHGNSPAWEGSATFSISHETKQKSTIPHSSPVLLSLTVWSHDLDTVWVNCYSHSKSIHSYALEIRPIKKEELVLTELIFAYSHL